MRPRRIEMEGFGAFRQRTVVDFTDTEFFALVGPTGSGKSTVIDAICYALYGVVPRLGDKRISDALSIGAVEMRVSLSFEVSGVGYIAARVVRKNPKGKVTTAEARLERVDGSVVLAGRESEFERAIEQLLGLTVDDFTRCVVLPQGAFARFLHDKPGERHELLVRLLDLGVYGAIAAQARAKAAELDLTIRGIDGRLDEIGVSDPAEIERCVSRAAELAVFERDASETQQWALEQLGEMYELDRRQVTLNSAIERLLLVSVPAGIDDRSGELRRVEQSLVDAAAAVGAAAERLTELDQRRADLGERHRIESARTKWREHSRLTAAVQDARTQVDRAASALATIELRRTDTEQAHKAAAAVFDSLRTRHRSYHLAVELVPGEPCPVCEQHVDRLPLPSPPPDFRDAQDRERTAADELRQLTDQTHQASNKHDVANHRLADAQRALHELEVVLAALPQRETLDRLEVQFEMLDREVDNARAAETAARDAERRGRKAEAHARALHAEFATCFQAQRDPLVADGAPPASPDDLVGSWTRLAEWAASRRLALADELVTAQHQHAELRTVVEQRVGEVVDRAGHLHIRVQRTDLNALVSTIAGEIATLNARVAAAQLAIQRRVEFEQQRGELLAQRQVAAELARLLKIDNFQKWLVEETLAALAERAAVTLRRLSAGQFSLALAANGEFDVVDHNAADERRPVRTLSGGETFQASLALALALSDHLSELSGKAAGALDSIFLDEGFGTLDAESLDVVASTVESLGAEGRMVGIITHVRELADRVPVRYRVSKDAQSSHVVREVTV